VGYASQTVQKPICKWHIDHRIPCKAFSYEQESVGGTKIYNQCGALTTKKKERDMKKKTSKTLFVDTMKRAFNVKFRL
jgi:hypothetical protein